MTFRIEFSRICGLLAAGLLFCSACAENYHDEGGKPSVTTNTDAQASPGSQAEETTAETKTGSASEATSKPSSKPVDQPAADAIAKDASMTSSKDEKTLETATLGAGCFWCIEAVLLQIDGVESVESGYTGGHVINPTYEQVCSKKSGHIEVVRIQFDPQKLPFPKLLDWFEKLHDPTSLDKQGNDSGPQYRSAIFYHSEAQRLAAEAWKKAGTAKFVDPVVTEIRKTETYYPAERYHQNYYEQNKNQGYCQYVIAPKLKKLGLKP